MPFEIAQDVQVERADLGGIDLAGLDLLQLRFGGFRLEGAKTRLFARQRARLAQVVGDEQRGGLALVGDQLAQRGVQAGALLGRQQQAFACAGGRYG